MGASSASINGVFAMILALFGSPMGGVTGGVAVLMLLTSEDENENSEITVLGLNSSVSGGLMGA